MLNPAPPDPAAFSRRLSSRLEEKGWGYKEFQRRVREATGGARGTSYGSVWAYVNGEVAEPRPWIVAAMADVLGLSREWLATGEGPRTLEEVARTDLEDPAHDIPHTRDAEDRVRALVRAMELARGRLPAIEAQLLARRDHVLENLVIDLLECGGRGLESYGEGEVAEAITLVAWLLTLPLRMMDPDDHDRRLGERGAYVLSMAGALRVALPQAPDGHPFGILSRLRKLRAAMGEANRGGATTESSAGGSPVAH